MPARGASHPAAGILGDSWPVLEGCLLPCPSSRGLRRGVGCLFSLRVVLPRPVRGRVLVRLLDPLDPVDLPDVARDRGRDEGRPVPALEHPPADIRAREGLAVDEGRGEDLHAVLPEQPDDEVRVRVHDVEVGDEGPDVAHPYAVDVCVGDRDDVVLVDACLVEAALDHLVPFARGEWVLPRVAVLGGPDPEDDFVVRLEDPPDHREMAVVERLKPPDEEGAGAGQSISSSMKWSMYSHSIPRHCGTADPGFSEVTFGTRAASLLISPDFFGPTRT